MAETVFLKADGLGILRPIDISSEEIVRGMAGKEVKAVLTMPRNARHHRKYFALMNVVFDAQEYFKNIDHMRKSIECELEFCDVIQLKDRVLTIPKSISFARMDQNEFEKLYDRTLDFIVEKVLPNIDRSDLVREVEEFLGG